ncbi:hypothetical protein QYE76_045556 [Lolium multiflorum]|uniref:Retrotransposon protein, putative, Ty3-gypsy subclass n=1 Tax=Lolium multiflorum TaxID=4521 RepID=A0AAD8X072_LOLMU|nr:hypothetical protein QYE76_045556 [Lolium multiflorum]
MPKRQFLFSAVFGFINLTQEIFSELDETKSQGLIFHGAFQKTEGDTKWGHEVGTPQGGTAKEGPAPPYGVGPSIKETQKGDEDIEKIKENLKEDKAKSFSEDEQGTVWFGKRICVANDPELRKLIFQEAHETPYSIHPGNTKMYMDLKEKFWWNNMKRDIAEYIAKCDVCSRVKAEHQNPAGLLQPLKVPEWKWDQIDYGTSWDDSLSYAEFSYNNSYQASIEMSPFEALYGRKCTTPLLWSGVGERSFFGPDIIQEAEEKVRLIKDRLKIAQSRQKSYADNKRRDVSYEIGDRVYLRISPLRGVKRFGIKGKLAPRFIGPFKILSRKGEVVYEIELPEILSAVHNVFHVSQLKKCHPEMSETPLKDTVPLEEVQLESDLTYQEKPIKILERAERNTRAKTIKFCKVGPTYQRGPLVSGVFHLVTDPDSISARRRPAALTLTGPTSVYVPSATAAGAGGGSEVEFVVVGSGPAPVISISIVDEDSAAGSEVEGFLVGEGPSPMDKAAAGQSGLAPADEADAARSEVEVGFVGAGLALADGAPAGPALADGALGRSEVEGAGPALRRRRRQHCHQTRTPTPRTITPPPPAPPPTAVLMTDQHRPSWASRRPPGLCTQGPTANEHCREEEQKVKSIVVVCSSTVTGRLLI